MDAKDELQSNEDQATRGCFITFEGGEGSGKSTQAALLVSHIESLGKPVVRTREPGGSPGGELIRKLLVEGPPERWDEMTEYLLFTAARRDHISRLIKPALAQGQWVVCDRFLDSSRVYQGIAGGLGLDVVNQIYQMGIGSFAPDLTFILDVPAEEGLQRAHKRLPAAQENRFEKKSLSFHQNVRQAYHKIATQDPQRCALIDGAFSPEKVFQSILHIFNQRLPHLLKEYQPQS